MPWREEECGWGELGKEVWAALAGEVAFSGCEAGGC